MQMLDEIPQCFKQLKNPPKRLFFKGNVNLLNKEPKIAIVGTRKPNQYTKAFVATLAKQIASRGGIVVSGGAIGVDIIAHSNALPNTIMLSPSSLDIIYPQVNKAIIEKISKESLILSEYEPSYMPHRFSFLERNRLVIVMSDIIIIPQADKQSGSSNSARMAREQGKPIYTLPHRIGESEGTNELLAQNQARAIFSIEEFIDSIFGVKTCLNDEIIEFCKSNPSFELAYAKFGDKLYEYELEGKLMRESGCIRSV